MHFEVPVHDCPTCGRTEVPGDVDRETRHLWLRRHKKPDARQWCSSKRRVDAGLAPPELLAGRVVVDERSGAEVMADAFVSDGFVQQMHGMGPSAATDGTGGRAARRALDRYQRRRS